MTNTHGASQIQQFAMQPLILDTWQIIQHQCYE
jgi:hypothetical protein